jgi:hypothetical protein
VVPARGVCVCVCVCVCVFVSVRGQAVVRRGQRETGIVLKGKGRGGEGDGGTCIVFVVSLIVAFIGPSSVLH